MIKRVISYIYRKTWFNLYRYFSNRKKRKLVSNLTPTIISSNCIGGLISKDLNLAFNSPTVGLFFNAPCFIKFCSNIDHYLSEDLFFVKESKYIDYKHVTYPIGMLDDIEIHFMHYASSEEARAKWNRRVKRVNKENIYFIMTERDSCNDEILCKFDSLNYPNKVCFTTKKLDSHRSNIFCNKYFKESEIPSDFASFRKYEKYFDIIEFLNG